MGWLEERKKRFAYAVSSFDFRCPSRFNDCNSIMYVWYGTWAMCVLCVCAGVFGFWKRFSPVVCARSPVGNTSVAVETPDMPVFNFGARWVLRTSSPRLCLWGTHHSTRAPSGSVPSCCQGRASSRRVRVYDVSCEAWTGSLPGAR